jgi:oligo-alginate lyase
VGGVRWISDPGMDDYGALEAHGLNLWNMDQGSDRWRVFRLGQQAHSLLVLNDQPQSVTGRGEIRGIDLATSTPTAIADLTSLYRGQAQFVQRRFTLHGVDRLVIDDLVGGIAQAGELRWQGLTLAAVEIQGSQVILRQAGQRVSLTMASARSGAWAAEPVDTLRQPFDAPLPGATRVTWRTAVAAGDDFSGVVTIQPIP